MNYLRATISYINNICQFVGWLADFFFISYHKTQAVKLNKTTARFVLGKVCTPAIKLTNPIGSECFNKLSFFTTAHFQLNFSVIFCALYIHYVRFNVSLRVEMQHHSRFPTWVVSVGKEWFYIYRMNNNEKLLMFVTRYFFKFLLFVCFFFWKNS